MSKAIVETSQIEPLVIPKVTGYVTYDVEVNCPHCDKALCLNQYPYTGCGDYELAEDELGSDLFGSTIVPAKWEDFEIQYKCCGCKKDFILNAFEI